MEKLLNSDIDTFRLRMIGARAEVQGLVEAFERSSGDVREAYKKVIADKLWLFRRMNVEFYNLTMRAVLALQKHLGEPLRGETSYTASALPENAPSA